MGSLFHKKLFLLLALACIGFGFFGFGIFNNAAVASSNQDTQAQFTQAERDWLTSHPIVKVAVSQDYAPISFMNEDGQHVGISADYLEHIQRLLKAVNPQFQFQAVVPNPIQKAANDPLDKMVDLVVDFVQTPERQKYWQFTKPYLELPLHLIVRQDSKITVNLNQHGNINIAVVGYYAAHELIARDYPNLKLDLVGTNQEGLKKVAFGEVDAYVSDLPVASYWASKAGLVQLKDAGKLPYSYKISLASNHQIPLLHSILEKSLAHVQQLEQEQIIDRWMIGPFINKSLLSNLGEWLALISAVLLALAAAWLIWRIICQNRRLAKQQQALTLLTQYQLRQSLDSDVICREITQIAAETIRVERASIWLFDKTKTQLECKSLYLKSTNTHTNVEPLVANDLPIYFDALATHRVITITNAMQDPITFEFKPVYLLANNIGAMLDGTISLNGETVGVICLEHTGNSRRWTLDEQNFVGSLADLCRISLETCRRREAEQVIMKLNENLEQEVVARALLLRETEKRYNYVLQHAPIPILILKKNGEIVEVNPEAEAAFGATREDMLGKIFVDSVVADESRKTAVLMAARSLRGRSFRNVELMLKNVNGKQIEHVCSIGMVTDADDGQGQMVAIAQNISQQKLLQHSLTKAREAAESADRIKSMFVASMSHELRTPLNSIIGFLGVVLQGMSGELNVKQKDQLGRAYHSSKHLLSLITDVIDVSKIEAGFLQVHVEKFDLSTLLVDVQHATQHLAEERKLYLNIGCPANLTLETDRKRLYQAVLNVVSNGLKYTEEGGVKVLAGIKANQLQITVQDTGIGIDEPGLAKLFKPFERIESHLKIRTLGTGLGLYLTRKILTQLLGGNISVTSKLAEGSIFTIYLPTKIPTIIAQKHTSILEDAAP